VGVKAINTSVFVSAGAMATGPLAKSVSKVSLSESQQLLSAHDEQVNDFQLSKMYVPHLLYVG
jgi:hypothetical protein